MQSIFEAMGGIYTRSGDYLIPNTELHSYSFLTLMA